MKGKVSKIWRLTLALVLVLSMGLVMAVPAMADVLPTVTATPDNDVAGATANYLIEFTTATSGNLTTVDMEFPADFDVSAAALGTISGIGDGTIDVTGQVVTYTVDDPVIIDDGVDISIALGNIVNTETPADDYGVSITTKDDEATTIDGPTDSDAFEIVQGAAASLEIVADDDIIDAGDTATYTATMTNAYGVEFDVTDETTFETPVAAGGEWTDNAYESEFIGVWTVTGTYGDVENTATLFVEGMELDTAAYNTGDAVNVTVVNKDANTLPGSKQTIAVKAKSTTDTTEVTIALQETSANSSIFKGPFTLVNTSPGAGEVLVSHGDTVTVTYVAAGYEETALVDDIAPTLDLESLTPEDGAVTNDATPVISAEYADDGDGSGIDTSSVTITVDGVDVTNNEDTEVTGTAVTYAPTDNLTDGDIVVVVSVSDLAGNTDEATWTFTVDTVVLTISDFTPADGEYVNDNTPVISAVLSDATSGIDAESIVMTVDGVDISENATFTAATGVLTYTPTDNLTDGEITATINVSDLAGNAAEEASWTFTIDTDELTVTIDEVTSPTNVATQAISGTFTETNLDTIVVTVNGVEVDVTTDEEEGTWQTTDNVTLTEGDNAIVATITDLAGNEESAEATIVLDTLAPEVTNAAADPSIIQPDMETEVTFSASVTDVDGSGIDTVTIDLSSIGGEEDQAMTDDDEDGIYEYTWADLSVTDNGTYELPITATDIAGNENSTVSIALNVIADTVAPVITDPAITYPFDLSSAMPGDGVTISANVTEDIALDSVTAECDAFAGPVTMLDADEDGIFTGTAAIAEDAAKGDYTITITAADIAGNEATDETLTLTVNPAVTGYELNLVKGWNLISLPLIPLDTDITVIVSASNLASENVSSVGIVRAYDPETAGFPYYMPETGSGELTKMHDGYGFWVFMNEDDTLTIIGRQWPAPPAVMPTYQVVPGWNLIGFKSLNDDEETNYLASLNYSDLFDPYPVIWSYNAVAGAYQNVKGGTMIVGHGFWIWLLESGFIVPPQ